MLSTIAQKIWNFKNSGVLEEVKYVTNVSDLPISEQEASELKKVTDKYPFFASSYYLGLINWEDKDDPIRRVIVPCEDELEDEGWGAMDPSGESLYTKIPGMQHKYGDTALLLVSSACGGLCRYCFRKRLFMENRENEALRDIDGAMEYLKSHKEIKNVLLTGGDPLMLSTDKLRPILEKLNQIDHIQTVRIGTKMLSYNPYRVIDDVDFQNMVKEYSSADKRLYFMLHFCHPRELSEEAVTAVSILLRCGATLLNQHPLLAGINDNPATITELHEKLARIGIAPYYVFQVRPTIGNKPYSVPMIESCRIFNEARRQMPGIAKRARLAMSHKTGKIEMLGSEGNKMYVKYHRAANPDDMDKIKELKLKDEQYWL